MATIKGAVFAPRVAVSTRTVKDAATAKVLDDMQSSMNDALSKCSIIDQPSAVLITSPSGYIYSIAVSDTGTLSATLVRKP